MSNTRVVRLLSQRSADNMVDNCVEEVFHKYNKSGDGRMTREETMQFVRDTYGEYTNDVPGNEQG